MENLNFYIVDSNYVAFLQKAEQVKRGFSRVPNVDYSEKQKPKFLCGVVLTIGALNYYVPVSSYKQKKPDNFLIFADNGKVTSSLRFNYMFPVPMGCIRPRRISTETDMAYKLLLEQELTHCIKNQETICSMAERTYKRVLLGKNQGLVHNSCDFPLLEQKCIEYTKNILQKKRKERDER